MPNIHPSPTTKSLCGEKTMRTVLKVGLNGLNILIMSHQKKKIIRSNPCFIKSADPTFEKLPRLRKRTLSPD